MANKNSLETALDARATLHKTWECHDGNKDAAVLVFSYSRSRIIWQTKEKGKKTATAECDTALAPSRDVNMQR
jgi:hypothetical protein